MAIRNAAQLQVSTFGARRLHQPYQRSQPARVDKFHVVQLENDISVLDDRIANRRVQREHLIAGHDSSMALHNQNIANRTALETKLHRYPFGLLLSRRFAGRRQCTPSFGSGHESREDANSLDPKSLESG